MKKIMMIAAMMVATLGAVAQNEVGQFTLKPMVGLNLASITKGQNSKMRVGVAAGFEGEYGVSKNFGVSAGLLYSLQGVKENGTMDIDLPVLGNVKYTGDATTKLDFINIPILANYYIVKGLAIKAGIQPGFCVSKKLALKGTATTYDESVAVDSDEKIEDGVKSFQFAIPVGVSYEYQNFVLDARYNIYATKALKNSDSRHSLFTISLGYKFSL
jgi:hypothetical protein